MNISLGPCQNAWLSFKDLVNCFLGNRPADNYTEIATFPHFLENLDAVSDEPGEPFHQHLRLMEGRYRRNRPANNYTEIATFPHFLENLDAVSDEPGEPFHQDLRLMEGRYRSRWHVHMMADYCWSIRRDCSKIEYSRKTYKRKFLA
ncbi:hypothetical protein ILUMI_14417 [Ignelater luminosus]|uniref:Uncharacterized protein n=1 Tax=Ignelater luminosus TaxID=2038154 RepID=A0A8K0CU98_IGNLU|nr:hypothetical protein ILUMI_14417 [Ignelater luminosus]